jgi:hypothetical protein
MQGLPPHLPGSIVMRGWVVAVIPEVYLGADQRVILTRQATSYRRSTITPPLG